MAKSADPNRREDILKAAREVFKRSGYEKAHVEDIAQLAGVAKGTVYLYFKSKQAMLDALCDYYQEMISDALVSSMQNPDTHTAIKEAVHAGLAVASRERDLLKLLDLRLGLKAGGDAIENPRGQKILRRFFRERVANGDMQDFDPVIASELTGESSSDPVSGGRMLRVTSSAVTVNVFEPVLFVQTYLTLVPTFTFGNVPEPVHV